MNGPSGVERKGIGFIKCTAAFSLHSVRAFKKPTMASRVTTSQNVSGSLDSPVVLSYLTLDAGQAAAAGLWFTEALAVTATVLPGYPQLVQLPLLLLIDLLYAGRFEQHVPPLGRIRVEEGTIIQVGPTDVNLILRDVIHRQSLCLLTLLGTVLGQLGWKQRRKVHSGACVYWELHYSKASL